MRGITFGAFDAFHIGHLNLLRNAKIRCDELIVCVSTDEYIRKIKKTEPLYKYQDRHDIVSAIKYVDIVDRQSLHHGKKEAIKDWKPDMIFVGDDWTPETFTGEGLGVPVTYLNYTKGISTTLIKEKYATECRCGK